MAQTVDELSNKEPEVYHTDGDVVLAEIDEDGDTGDPIFAYAKENGSYTVFCMAERYIRILYVHSEEEGDMSDLVDRVVNRFGCNDVRFFNIINTELGEKLDNPSTKTIQIMGQKIVVADVEWEA